MNINDITGLETVETYTPQLQVDRAYIGHLEEEIRRLRYSMLSAQFAAGQGNATKCWEILSQAQNSL